MEGEAPAEPGGESGLGGGLALQSGRYTQLQIAFTKDLVMWPAIVVGALLAALGVGWLGLRRRHMQRWLPAYLARRHRAPRYDRDIHVLFCFADHYEPKAYEADVATGRRRVATWAEAYPRQFGHFRDSDGRPPRYTFFFPAEEYEREYLDLLAELCRAGYGEVEVHLHHDRDTAEGFRSKLIDFRDCLVREHGLLGRHKASGAVAYGFIHGNWALCNSRPDGRWCGVNNELEILRETGCYADFTYPSAPSATQPPIINRIYHARNLPGRPRSHEVPVPPAADTLLLVQGPLVLDWSRRRFGLIPAVENGCLQASQPPDIARLPNWLRAGVQVAARPDWYFVKLHAHGAPEDAHEPLLGAPMVRFHEDLTRLAQTNPRFHYHYVTAREMANLVQAAEAGYQGPVAGARDHVLLSNLGAPSDALRR